MNILYKLKNEILMDGEGPLLTEMPSLSLLEKLQYGPTAAHRIEQVHTPLNYAYISCTTGTSALQNIVGVTWGEMEKRKEAALRALKAAGLEKGHRLLITYPPLMSVFTPDAIEELGVTVSFITRPSRDSLVVDLASERPNAVIGESSFLRAGLSEARKLDIEEFIPEDLIIIAAGSPMDPELYEEAERIKGAVVHDLYGCQEFGWMCLDGMPVRDDLTLMDVEREDGKKLLICGGLPTGDCFPVEECSIHSDGKESFKIFTPGRSRMDTEPEVLITGSHLADRQTVVRCARAILRCKARIVRVADDCRLRCEATSLKISVPGIDSILELSGPYDTALFDSILESQRSYQADHRADPVWNKKS